MSFVVDYFLYLILIIDINFMFYFIVDIKDDARAVVESVVSCRDASGCEAVRRLIVKLSV